MGCLSRSLPRSPSLSLSLSLSYRREAIFAQGALPVSRRLLHGHRPYFWGGVGGGGGGAAGGLQLCLPLLQSSQQPSLFLPPPLQGGVLRLQRCQALLELLVLLLKLLVLLLKLLVLLLEALVRRESGHKKSLNTPPGAHTNICTY
jgi:hypothetical protein